jgi:hypothetical protein
MATDTRPAHARAFLKNALRPGHAWSSLPYAYDYETEKAMYLGWFDDNPKKAATDKAWEAIAAYREKFGSAPTVILVNEADKGIEIGGIVVRSEGYIRRNNFWVGFESAYV